VLALQQDPETWGWGLVGINLETIGAPYLPPRSPSCAIFSGAEEGTGRRPGASSRSGA